MIKRIALTFATFAMAVAMADTHRVNLSEAVTVGGQELQAGDYKLEVKDSKAVLTRGKQTVEAAVKVETNGEKFRGTSVRYQKANGGSKLHEIRIGGTNMKLVFGDTTASLR